MASIKKGHVKKLFAILASLVALSIACNFSPSGPLPTSFPPPSVSWMTNTPDSSMIGQTNSTATPTSTGTPTTPVPIQTEGTPEPTRPAPITVTPQPDALNTAPYLYYAQSGDTLQALSIRFDAHPDEMISPDELNANSLLEPGQLIIIPRRLFNTTTPSRILPDSEFLYSATVNDLDLKSFIDQAGGELSTYRQYLGSTGWTTGAEVVARISLENSINPRLLLSLLEYQSGMVYGQPIDSEYPLGHHVVNDQGLYRQLAWMVNQLSIGYYGWREGRLTNIEFQDGVSARLAPDLNAGTVAIHYYFAINFNSLNWLAATDQNTGWPALHKTMFGAPEMRSSQVEPLFPPALEQPDLILPFWSGQVWSFSGGPHGAWEREGSFAAIDFAPTSDESGCVESFHWITASADGMVVRSERGVVVIDLDGDGRESTGWALVYLHVADNGRIPLNTWVSTGQRIGHPSCEGGYATGTHVHFARKFNGEWIAADGPVPLVLNGWAVHAGNAAYKGYLERDNETIQSSPYGESYSLISRPSDDPYNP